MTKSVAERIAEAATKIGVKSADDSALKTARVDGAIYGGQAPAVLKSMAAHIQATPAFFGVKSIAQIFGVGEIPTNGRPGADVCVAINLGDKKSFRHVDADLKAVLLDLKKNIHNAQIQQQIMVRKTMMPVALESTPYWKAVVEPMLKSFSLTDFSAWVPTLNTGFYFEELELSPVIDSYFPTYDMASRTVTVPGALTRLKGKLVADTTTFTGQYNTQSSYQMTAQDCVVHTDITEDLMQDLVPSAGGFERIRREVAMGILRSKEDAILNGDDSTTTVQGDAHMDSDTAALPASEFNKAFKGLRKRALAAGLYHDNQGDAIDLTTYNGLIRKLGKFAKEKGDLLVVLGPSISNNIITGNVPEILTHEKFAGNATISTGNLPRVFGIEQYESEWVREDVNSSGVYAAAQALTTLTLVKKSRFVVGTRAPMKIWATPSLADADKLLLSAKERFTFGGIPQSATETSVALAINVALT